MKNDEQLTTFGAAKILDLSTERIRQMDREGKLRSTRAGGGRYRLFRRADVERLAEQRRALAAQRHGDRQAELASLKKKPRPAVKTGRGAKGN